MIKRILPSFQLYYLLILLKYYEAFMTKCLIFLKLIFTFSCENKLVQFSDLDNLQRFPQHLKLKKHSF